MGENWAIAIGINDYENLQNLNYAQRDAEAMETWFREAYFDQVFLFTKDSPPNTLTTPAFPTEPTYGYLRRFFRAQFEKPQLKAGDNLWFFFAGHRSEEHTSELQSHSDLVCRLLLEKKKKTKKKQQKKKKKKKTTTT